MMKRHVLGTGMKQLIVCTNVRNHYENMPIQMYWKFYNQKMKIFR